MLAGLKLFKRKKGYCETTYKRLRQQLARTDVGIWSSKTNLVKITDAATVSVL